MSLVVDHFLHHNSYHPVKDRLIESKWDKKKRIDTWLIDWAKCEDTIVSRESSRLFLVASVARTFVPGRKYDICLLFIGKQDLGKSTMLKMLAEKEVWFEDGVDLHHVKQKEMMEQMQGVRIVEFAEMAGFNKADDDKIKKLITKGHFRARKAFGKRTSFELLESVYTGTSNNEKILKDTTGNRRWIILRCGDSIDLEKFEEVVGQLWAEAYEVYLKEYALTEDEIEDGGIPKSKWLVLSPEAKELAKVAAEEARIPTTNEHKILAAIAGKTGWIWHDDICDACDLPSVQPIKNEIAAVLQMAGAADKKVSKWIPELKGNRTVWYIGTHEHRMVMNPVGNKAQARDFAQTLKKGEVVAKVS